MFGRFPATVRFFRLVFPTLHGYHITSLSSSFSVPLRFMAAMILFAFFIFCRIHGLPWRFNTAFIFVGNFVCYLLALIDIKPVATFRPNPTEKHRFIRQQCNNTAPNKSFKHHNFVVADGVEHFASQTSIDYSITLSYSPEFLLLLYLSVCVPP